MADAKIRAKGEGSWMWRNGHRMVRVSLPDKTRPWYRLCKAPDEPCTCHGMSEGMADERARAISERERARVAGELGKAAAAGRGAVTIEAFGTDWTEGRLHKRWPDHIKAKRSSDDDAERLKSYVYPHVGSRLVAAFTIDAAERVMAELPPRLSPATRRQVAQLMHRLMAMAVYPARLRSDNPLPRGFLPKVRGKKADQWLYPDEERKLLAHTGDGAADVAVRLLFGFLAREGMRKSEALALEWTDLDLKHGVLKLDVNKTDDPRAWALGDDVGRALERWRVLSGNPTSGRVFVHLDGTQIVTSHLAELLRDSLEAAGVTRTEIFEASKSRMAFRVHDLRGTFVTLSLAQGRSEAWVSDRTGHKSSAMIYRYKRAARTAAELGLGWLAPLDKALPELAAIANVRTLQG